MDFKEILEIIGLTIESTIVDGVENLGAGFELLGEKLKITKTGLLKFVSIAGLVTAAFASIKMYEDAKKERSFDSLSEKAFNTEAEAESEREKVESLNSELQTTQKRIDELNSKEKLTVVEEGELQRLKEQTKELERQKKVAEDTAKAKTDKAAMQAYEAVTKQNYKTKQDKKDDKVLYHSDGFVDRYDAYAEESHTTGTQLDKMEDDLKAYEKLKKKYNDTFEKYNGADNAKQKKKYADKLKEINVELAESEKSLTDAMSKLNKNKELMLKSDAATYDEQIKAISNLDLAYEKAVNGLTKDEYKNKTIESAFSNLNLSFVKDQLSEMAEKSELTAKDIERLGLAIDGVNAYDIARYFNEMAKSAKEAADATTKFGTLAEYEKALGTKNAGDDYLKMVDGLEATKELWDKGLTGTDEFKSFAKMLSPSGATDANNFIENYNHLKKYFDKDTNKGMQNFLSDLSKETDKAGKSFAEFDKKTGQWKFNIEDTAEAAKALDMGIAPFEAMLGRLQDYDFDIDFRSAIQDFNDVKTSLEGFDSILDKMQDGEKKDALKEQVDGWKSQLAGWERDLSTLDTDVVAKIKLEYNLAELQAEIDQWKSKIDWGSASSENYSNLLAGNEKYINAAKENLGFNQEGIEIPVQYKATEDSIAQLKQQLSKTTDEKAKVEIQAKIANLQEMQKDLLDAFSDAHPEINMDSTKEEINQALAEFSTSPIYNEIIGNYDIDTSSAQLAIAELNGQTIEMDAEASTDQIWEQIREVEKGEVLKFKAELEDGSEIEVNGFQDKSGVIKYIAEIDGVEKEVESLGEQDGVIVFEADTSEAEEEIRKVDTMEFANKVIELTAEDNATPYVKLWNELQVNPKFTSLSAQDQATYVIGIWNSLTPEQKEAYLNGEISVVDTATGEIQAVDNSLVNLQSKLFPHANITATENATSKVSSASLALDGINGKTAHTYIITHQSNADGPGHLTGTAHMLGTISRDFKYGRSYSTGSLNDTSWIKDNWRTKKGEIALTGEIGRELVVDPKTSRWWTVGDKGAGFEYIPSGAAIFSAKQTKELLEKGRITSGNGRAEYSGSAYLSGTAYVGSSKGGGAWQGGIAGSSSSSKKKPKESSKSSSSKSSAEKAEKATEEVLDWIETLLKRVARQTEIAVEAIDNAIGLANKQAATANAISKVQAEIAKNQEAKNAYMNKANSVGLSSDYINKIQNGSLNIDTITDENLKKKIDDYKKWLTSAT